MEPATNHRPISIGVYFYYEEEGQPVSMRQLVSTSRYLTRIQFIPVKGDWLSIQSDDWAILGIEADETIKSVMMVDSRIISFGFVDVGIICRFQEWPNDSVPDSTWQQIPLN